jgi:deazaflavin-dependent oxidoreductase (nitroreductase family)
MAFPKWLAHVNRRVTNPITRTTVAGRLPWFGIVLHTGRRSGRPYRTPVMAFRTGDGYLIAVSYGPDSDWVRNVLAAGGCALLTRGRRVRLVRPRLVTDETRRDVPAFVGLVLRAIRVDEFMRLAVDRAA